MAEVPKSGWRDDEQCAQSDDDQVGQDAEGELTHALAFPRDRARQIEHDRDLGELRWLQAERPDADPAPRAAARDADARNQHQRQRHQGADQQRVGEALEPFQAHVRDHQQQRRAAAKSNEVFAEEHERVAVAILRVEVAGVEHHDDAEPDQAGGGDEQPQIGTIQPRHDDALAQARQWRQHLHSASTNSRKRRPRAA